MNDVNLIEPRGLQRQVQCFRDVPDFHRRAELPGNDVAREVVQYRAEIEPAPADYLEVGEVYKARAQSDGVDGPFHGIVSAKGSRVGSTTADGEPSTCNTLAELAWI